MSQIERVQEAQIFRAQEVIKNSGFTYQALADEFSVNLGQIKHFMSGRLKKVPPEIEDLLVNKLNINPIWLVEGIEPRLKTDISMAKVRSAVDAAIEVALRFAPLSQSLISDMQDAVFSEKLNKEQLMERFKGRLPTSVPIESELTLIDNYRSSSEENKRTIEQVAKLAAQSTKTIAIPLQNDAEKPATAPRYTVDFGKSNIGQAIAGDVKNNKFKNKQK